MFNFISPILANLFQKIILRYAILFSLLLSINNSLAYEYIVSPELKFESITIQDGLSQSYVYDIVEDKQGLIWIATQEGLNRFDGNEFVHYKNNMTIPDSLANNFIRKVFVDDTNTLWVGTQKGLSKYNRSTDSFENYTHQKQNSYSLKDDIIWNVYQDNTGRIWVTTETGIHIYQPKTNNFKRIKVQNYEKELTEIKTVFQDAQNNYWLGTYEKGIYILSSDLKSAAPLSSDNKWGLSINAKRLSNIVIVDNDYWLATDLGVYIVDKEYNLKHHLNSNSENSKLISNSVRTIIQIDDTEVWIGTQKGLTTYNLHTQKTYNYIADNTSNSLVHNRIYNFYKDSSNKIWISTDGGINIFSSISMSFEHSKFINDDVNQVIDAMVELPNGEIIFAREDGYLFKIKDSEYIQLPLKLEKSVINLISTLPNHIIIRTINNNLYIYNMHENSLVHHEQWKVKSNIISDFTDESSLLSNAGFLWFINSDGTLTNYNLYTRQFNLFENKNTKLTTLHLDESKEFIWATSKNNNIKDSHSRHIYLMPHLISK